MIVDLTDDEIGLIQEAIYTKIYSLDAFNRINSETEEQKEYRALNDKLDKILEQGSAVIVERK